MSFLRYLFQLTPSRRATDGKISNQPTANISTHALTEGDDVISMAAQICCISTHALTEGDTMSIFEQLQFRKFQLTPSRRATP